MGRVQTIGMSLTAAYFHGNSFLMVSKFFRLKNIKGRYFCAFYEVHIFIIFSHFCGIASFIDFILLVNQTFCSSEAKEKQYCYSSIGCLI